ncbi:MAG: hypothetical protein AABY16_02750 [Nanoarchaeota archaeon]
MKIKRAIGIAVALYIITFVIGVILTLVAKEMLQTQQNAQTTYWLITIVVTILLTSLASLWYFNGKNIIRNIAEGLKLGVTFIISSFVLDLISLIPVLISTGNTQGLFEYYKDPTFYLIALLVLGTAVFIGSRNQSSKNKIEKNSKNKLKDLSKKQS